MNDLYHFGILGMKWGVRRTPEQLGHRPSRREQYPRNKKKISSMSDKELQDKINRLNKEKQYKDLTQSTAAKAGKNLAKIILVAAATELAKEAFKGELKSGIPKAIDWVKDMAWSFSKIPAASIKG